MKKIIKNGTLITASETYQADILIEGEIIKAIGTDFVAPDAEVIDAGCCGMAGAFGFEREHYEASRAAFERALGPALAARPDARLVVMGISCRKQIEHFAGRPASHLVEVLRAAARPVAVGG